MDNPFPVEHLTDGALETGLPVPELLAPYPDLAQDFRVLRGRRSPKAPDSPEIFTIPEDKAGTAHGRGTPGTPPKVSQGQTTGTGSVSGI